MIERMFGSMVAAERVDEMSARSLLAAARAEQAVVRRAEANLLEWALCWAVLHPSTDGTAGADDAAVFFDAAGVEPLAGDGCPGVAEFAVAEFGTELGISTTAAKRLIGHALELAHRLPRLWARVRAGEVDAWRARRVAEATIHAHPRLTSEAAGWVDAQVAPFAGRVGQAQVDRLVESAIERFRLLDEGSEADDFVDQLHVTVSDGAAFAGTMDVHATLTVADGLDLENALRAGAEELKALGSEQHLGARRARALGELARRQTALDLASLETAGEDEAPVARRPVAARRLDLHLHFDVTAGGIAPTGALENGQQLVLLEQIKAWLGDSHTEIRVLPVLDLNTEIESAGYVPSPRLRRQVQLRDGTCVFPWCSRPARSCDVDHVVPYTPRSSGEQAPAQTRTSNLGALCRSHHRLKTHTGWRVESPANGVFVWSSPHGHRYLRDRGGTTRLEPPDPSSPALLPRT